MAIPYPLAEFLCFEHSRKPLPQRILLLGRQTICFDASGLNQLAKKFGLSTEGIDFSIDRNTIYSKQNADCNYISDTAFFKMLGVEHIDAIDHSDFEGANVICDICGDIPKELYGQFDFIFNGSVLDNVWDPPQALRNVSRLLSPKGRVVHVETATACRYNYTALSPSWYFDYYVVNNFGDCKIYVGVVDDISRVTLDPWQVLAFDRSAQHQPNAFTPSLGNKLGISIVLAEKTPGATCDTRPIQSYYRPDSQWADFVGKMSTQFGEQRPLYLGNGATGKPIAGHDEVWVSCGWWGQRNGR